MAEERQEPEIREQPGGPPAEERPATAGRRALPAWAGAAAGSAGFALALVGFALWFVRQRWTPGVWIPLALGAVLLAVWAVAYRHGLARAVRSRAFASAVSTTVAAISIVGLVAIGNYVAFRRVKGPWARWDLTKARLYSFSDQTDKVLGGLKKDVNIVAFYPPDEMMPLELNRARQVLEEFKGRSTRVRADIIDPDLHPEKAREYEVNFYPMIVVEAGDKRETLSQVNEESVINAILKVTRDTNPKAYFLSGHGEKDPNSASDTGMNLARRVLEKKLYQVDTLQLLGGSEVPADCDVLIIAGPRAALQPGEVEAIRRYLDGGGSVLAMIDPPPAPDLNAILQPYGLETPPELVREPGANVGGTEIFPAVLEYPSHDITRNLPYTVYLQARPVVKSGSAPAGVTLTELARTTDLGYATPEAGDVFQEAAREQQKEEEEEGEQKEGRRAGPLALVTIAFKGDDGTDSGESAEAPEAAQDETAPRAPRLAVCGDSDFATDQWLAFYGNGALFLNLVNWLAHEEDLIAVPPKTGEEAKVILTNQQRSLLVLVSLIFMPLAVILSGVVVWFVRR